MNGDVSLEQRVADLEAEIELLKEEVASLTKAKHEGWISRVEGSFADCPEFDEVIRLGSEFRKEQNEIEDFDEAAEQ